MTESKTWEERLSEILIDYDFEKDAPGAFDFIRAEVKIKSLFNSLLQEQRKSCAKTYNRCCIGAGDIPKPYFADKIENSPEPTGEKK